MPASVCPQCGAVLKGERARFCDQCGQRIVAGNSSVDSPKAEPQAQETLHERGTVYLAKLRTLLAAGDDLSPEAVEELNRLVAQLGIGEVQSKQLMNAALDSMEPCQADDMDEPEVSTSGGLSLSINIHRFYMAGIDGVLDVLLENLSDNTYESVDVMVSGNLLGRTEKWSGRFDSCGSQGEWFEVAPERPGPKIIRFIVDARQGDAVQSYCAKCDLPVFTNSRNLRDILQQASNMGNISAGTGKAMGNSVNNHIQIMVGEGKIRDANDLMMEYRRLPSRFERLELHLDPKRSEDLTAAHRQRTGAKRIVEPQRGSLTDSGSLLIEAKGKPVNILLLAKESVMLGKNRRNDVVTRICPRSPANDHQSNQMSRDHCHIDLTEAGVFVRDEGSANGTFFDGQRIDANGARVDQGNAELDLGGVLKLAVRKPDRRGTSSDAAYKDLMTPAPGPLWDAAERTGVDAVVLERLGNLGPQDENGREVYCLLYRAATIGSGDDCALSIGDKGLEPEHAAFLFLRDRLYLENRSDLTDVIVNERTLSRNELMPLSFGDRIHIGRLEMEFVQRAQLCL